MNQVQSPKTSEVESNPSGVSAEVPPEDHAGEIPCPPCRLGSDQSSSVRLN